MGRVTKGGRVSLPLLSLVGATLAAALVLPGGAGEEDTTGLLPAATCDRYEQMQAIDRRLVGPAVFDLERAALSDLLEERRQLVRQMGERSTGDLGAFLDDIRSWQGPFDEALLAGWETHRRRLAADRVEEWTWRIDVVGDTIVSDRGERIDTDDLRYPVSMLIELLAVGCHAPELADGPPEDTGEDPPEGRLMFYRPDDRGFEGTGRLHVADTMGGGERRVTRRSYSPYGHLDALLTGDGRVAVAVASDDELGVAVIGDAGVLLRELPWSDEPPSCLAWDDTGERLMAVDNIGRDEDRQIHLVDLADAARSRTLDLPFGSVGCADFVADDGLVVAEVGEDGVTDTGMWTMGIDGSDPRELYAATGCTTQVGAVDPSGTRVAIAQTCEDLQLSGILVVDLSSGDVTRVATGLGALPKWSPDGEWLVFGLIPLAQNEGMSIWVARADGRRLRQVVDGPAAFPVWLPDG